MSIQTLVASCSCRAAGCVAVCMIPLVTVSDAHTASLTVLYRGDFGSRTEYADAFINGADTRSFQCGPGGECESSFRTCVDGLDVLEAVRGVAVGALEVALHATSAVNFCPHANYEAALEVTAVRMPAPPPVPPLLPPSPPPPPCLSWCSSETNSWYAKCGWQEKCRGCDECMRMASSCKWLCGRETHPWAQKCSWLKCEGCPECFTPPPPSPALPSGTQPCFNWCADHTDA